MERNCSGLVWCGLGRSTRDREIASPSGLAEQGGGRRGIKRSIPFREEVHLSSPISFSFNGWLTDAIA